MTVRYCKLWKLLTEKNRSKAGLRTQADISSNRMTKLRWNEYAALPVPDRICAAPGADCGEIIREVLNEASPASRGSRKTSQNQHCKQNAFMLTGINQRFLRNT